MTSLYRRASRLVAHQNLVGYESAELIDTVFTKTWDRYQPSKFDNSELLNVINRLRPHTVLDFGGGAGVHYKQAQASIDIPIRWAIVETPSMTIYCNHNTRAVDLHWFTSIAFAKYWLKNVDLVLCNGALQYTSDPIAIANELAALNARELLYQRLRFDQPSDIESSWLSDHGPGPAWGPEAIVHVQRTRIDREAFFMVHNAYHDIQHTSTSNQVLFQCPTST